MSAAQALARSVAPITTASGPFPAPTAVIPLNRTTNARIERHLAEVGPDQYSTQRAIVGAMIALAVIAFMVL